MFLCCRSTSLSRSGAADWHYRLLGRDFDAAASNPDGLVLGGQHHDRRDRSVDDDLRFDAARVQRFSIVAVGDDAGAVWF